VIKKGALNLINTPYSNGDRAKNKSNSFLGLSVIAQPSFAAAAKESTNDDDWFSVYALR
jgi:hypothetical protein